MIVATWIQAIGTVLAFLAVAWQIWHESQARSAVEKRLDDELIRQHAVQVAAWAKILSSREATDLRLTAEKRQGVVVTNASSLPLYDVVISLVLLKGAGPHTGEDLGKQGERAASSMRLTLNLLPPGKWFTPLPKASWGGMSAVMGGEIAFTDATGVHWARRAGGDLERLDQSPLDAMAVQRPIGDGTLYPI